MKVDLNFKKVTMRRMSTHGNKWKLVKFQTTTIIYVGDAVAIKWHIPFALFTIFFEEALLPLQLKQRYIEGKHKLKQSCTF